MPILPIDSGRYGTKEMKAIFEEENKLYYESNGFTYGKCGNTSRRKGRK